MKFFKSIISLFLAAVLGCSMALNTSAQTQNPFKDVSASSWYYEDVLKANSQGIMIGTSENKFEPNAIVTREMFVTALCRMSIISCYNSSPWRVRFKDVKDGKWYSSAIGWATNMDIVFGINDTTFGLGKPVTREQIATFIYRYINNNYIYISLPEIASPAPSFSDTPSEYAKQAVEHMRKTGIINGVGNNKFAPGAVATRAQVAAILCRLNDATSSYCYKFNFNANSIWAIEVRQQIKDKNESIIKTMVATEKSVITREIEYINATPITGSHEIEPTDHWVYDIRFLDENGDVIIGSVIWKGGFKQDVRVFESNCFDKFIEHTTS